MSNDRNFLNYIQNWKEFLGKRLDVFTARYSLWNSSREVGARKSILNTWMFFFRHTYVWVFTYWARYVCDGRLEPRRRCLCNVVYLCAYFMTLSASLSNACNLYVCRFYFFFLNVGSVCTLVKFSCMGALFFSHAPFVFGLNAFRWEVAICMAGRKCIFQFYIADMRIGNGKENVREIKKMHASYVFR